jgi:hypothetical protein
MAAWPSRIAMSDGEPPPGGVNVILVLQHGAGVHGLEVAAV